MNGLSPTNMMHSNAVQTDQSVLQSALQKFSRVRCTTERICEPLETEDYVPQPIMDVSPPKWPCPYHLVF